MSAPAAEAGMSASAAPAAMTAPATAAAAATGNLYALAMRGIFPIENLKGRQTDVGDFLLGQNQSPCIVLRRYMRCGCGCRCSAGHRQRNPGRAQCQGCLFRQGCLLRFRMELRLACVMVEPPRQDLDQWTRGSFRALRRKPARCRFGSTWPNERRRWAVLTFGRGRTRPGRCAFRPPWPCYREAAPPRQKRCLRRRRAERGLRPPRPTFQCAPNPVATRQTGRAR